MSKGSDIGKLKLPNPSRGDKELSHLETINQIVDS